MSLVFRNTTTTPPMNRRRARDQEETLEDEPGPSKRQILSSPSSSPQDINTPLLSERSSPTPIPSLACDQDDHLQDNTLSVVSSACTELHTPSSSGASSPSSSLREGDLEDLEDNALQFDNAMSPEEIRDILKQYNVFYDKKKPIPQPLQMFIDNLGLPRNETSPNARAIAGLSYEARQEGEMTMRTMMTDPLLGVADPEGPLKYVARAQELNLKPKFNPESKVKKAVATSFPQAKPDTAFGFRNSNKAAYGAELAFTKDEEMFLDRNKLMDDSYFPFFTAQWKSELRSQTHAQALPQGARDGAVIITHLRSFFKNNVDHMGGLVSTSHFSCTLDGRSLIVWVHWFDVALDEFSMEEVASYWLGKESDMVDFRRFYRNFLDYVVGTRLAHIKGVIAKSLGELDPPDSKRRRQG
ncbi:hypothetical protein BDV96DRAFT_312060 [Lophiotrema nucula]|uniref:DUF7924 domain-containing protein n=1 Tax=Lophiotrema nucula TaxID=690887 RepID=A0A6A5ZLE1_9PLEO|nr:hypothetical protein BDV96DRAFT_312060 [Lophiotrema nucula]